MSDDATLLKDYAINRSEEAFAEVVRRHLPLVYPTALRQTNGDVHQAKDVAQIVFAALARDALKLSRHAALAGWLHAATRHTAIDLMRAERRRRQREETTDLMETSSSPGPSADWEQLRPVLDEAMGELDTPDREALLLRFFENRPFAAIGERLRLSEDAARKRVDRALDRLGAVLDRRGIRSTGGALAVLLANQVAHAAPPGIAASITAAAIAGAGLNTATGGGTFALFIMGSSKLTAVALLGGGCGLGYICGMLAPAAQTAEAADVKARGVPSAAVQVVAPRPSDHARPSPGNPGAESGAEKVFVDPATQLPALAAMHQQKLANISAWPINLEGQLTPAFRQLFTLSQDEESRLQHAMDAARRQLQEAQRQNAKIARADKNGIVVTAGAFDGGQVYDDLMDSVKKILGADRFGAFPPLMGQEFNRGMNNFGAEILTVTVTRANDANGPYHIAERRQGLLQAGGTITNRSARFGGVDSLPERYGWLAPMLGSLNDLAPPARK